MTGISQDFPGPIGIIFIAFQIGIIAPDIFGEGSSSLSTVAAVDMLYDIPGIDRII